MNVNGRARREFQLQIFKSQLKNCWQQFHQKANEWLQITKNQMEPKVSAETQKSHPNQIMTELKQINYQRAYIDYKIKSMKKDKKLPTPVKLQQKLEKLELSINFQQEFPKEFQQFTQELKNKLSSKPYRPVQKVIKPTTNQELGFQWDLNLSTENATKSKHKKPTPSISTLLRAIHGHGKTFKNHNGYYQPPMFTKAKVERIFSIYIPMPKFTQLKDRLNSIEQRKKRGRAKHYKIKRQGISLLFKMTKLMTHFRKTTHR